MRESFFPLTVLAGDSERESRIPRCGECGLDKKCRRPKLPPTGSGRAGILVVTDLLRTPEEVHGCHLSGSSGMAVTHALRRAGVDLRQDCWATSSLICSPGDRKLPAKAVAACRANLLNTVDLLKPEVIILLGGMAMQSLLPALTDEQVGEEVRWAGYRIPSTRLNAWVCPTFHPHSLKEYKSPVADQMFQDHIAAAVALKGTRPHAEEPDYAGMLRCVTDTDVAADVVKKTFRGNRIAFDFETTCLKPESPHARIVTCSISNGKVSVAFPWAGRVRNVVRNMLTAPTIRKIGSNIKFEDRWVRKHLGVEVKGWFWDTMLAAHALENNTKEKHITSIKFQAFVHLGVPSWDRVVGPYLKPKGGNDKLGNAKNRIEEVDLPSLLRYNAFDSLYEFLVAEQQIHRLRGINPTQD